MPRQNTNQPAVPKLKSQKPAGPALAPATSPQDACRRAVDAIVSAFPALMQALIEKAQEGSHQHAKFLCEFAGLSGALIAPGGQDDSLARLLLDKLQIGNEDSEADAAGPSSVL